MTHISAVTSKLVAVNILLLSIGEAPVGQLDSGYERADIAESVIEEVMRKVQLIGWNWNTEDRYPLLLNSDNEIVLPTNLLRLDAQNRRYVTRGTRLYDKVNHTYKFTGDVSATVVLFLQFDELPEIARQYITYAAGRVYQARVVSSTVSYEFTKEDENTAGLALQTEELESGNYSIFQNTELALTLDRSSSNIVGDSLPGLISGTFIDV